MIYSIIPYDMIMKVEDSLNTPQTEIIEYLGYQVEVQLLDASTVQIQRIHSTDLKAFLNPRLQPGMKISKRLN